MKKENLEILNKVEVELNFLRKIKKLSFILIFILSFLFIESIITISINSAEDIIAVALLIVTYIVSLIYFIFSILSIKKRKWLSAKSTAIVSKYLVITICLFIFVVPLPIIIYMFSRKNLSFYTLR